MNILQVLSQFEVTGAETFAATLADRQIDQGHQVFILSDNFYTPTKATVIAHPIGKRDLAQRRTNIAFLKDFIREHRIEVVHAHSRASSWVSFFATRGGSVPLVSSIHGRQHLHFSSKLYSIYGEKRVAVCRSIYDHLNHDLHYPLETLALVHNGIDLSKWEFRPHTPPKREKKVVAFVGRLSGFKGDTLLIIVEQVFPKVLEQYGDVEFHIIGGMNEKSKIIPAMEAVNRRVGREFIIAKGFSKDVEKVYRESDLIVGSGRVAMEALACGTPVISIGESNYVGILSPETEREALVTNFGDLDARRPIDVERSVASILSALRHPERISGAWGRGFIEKNFEITAVAEEIAGVYAEAVALKRGYAEIPVLSYHRIVADIVPTPPSFPGLFQSADLFGNARAGVPEGKEREIPLSQFTAQLRFLKQGGYTPLTFVALQEIMAFRRPLPARPVVLTFGTAAGNASVAAPLLESFGFHGVFQVRTDEAAVDGIGSVTMNDAAVLQRTGHELSCASHSMPKMNLIQPDAQQEEILGAKERVERVTGSPVFTYTYPHGYVTEELKRMAAEAGFRFGLCNDAGRRNFWIDPLKVRRIPVFAGTSAFSFWKKISGRYHWYKNVY